MTKELKFIGNEVCCCSDFHVSIHLNSPIWHKIALDFAEWLKTQLNLQGIKDIVISGDFWHDRNEVSVLGLHVANQFFKILKGFNIIILVGNHDAYYKDRADVNSIDIFNGWENIHIVNEITTIEAHGNKITFVPWAANIKNIPQSDLIFGHFQIANFKLNKNKICVNGISSVDLLEKARLIMTGHFHFRDERVFQNGTIVFLGSPYELDWSDAGTSKGIYLLDLKTLKYNFIPNQMSPKHIKFRLSEVLNSQTGILETLKQQVPGNFINFVIDKEVSSDKIEGLIHKLSSLQPLNVRTEFFDETKYSIEDVNYEFTGVDIPSAINEFINLLDIKDKQAVLNLTLDLFKRVS